MIYSLGYQTDDPRPDSRLPEGAEVVSVVRLGGRDVTLFASERSLGSDFEPVADSLDGPNFDRARWSGFLKTDSRADRLVDALVERWTHLSAPDSIDASKPVRPSRVDGAVRVFLPGMGCVWKGTVGPDSTSDEGRATWDRIRLVLEADYRKLLAVAEKAQPGSKLATVHLRYLASFADKVPALDRVAKPEEALAALLPIELRADARFVDPETTWTETFTASNGELAAASTVLSWVNAPSSLGVFNVSSNKCSMGTTGNETSYYATETLSADDMEVSADVTAINDSASQFTALTLVGRRDTADVGSYTAYGLSVTAPNYPFSSDHKGWIRKYPGGSLLLTMTGFYSGTTPFSYKLKCEDSTLTAYKDGASVNSTTNTDVTGNVNFGFNGEFGATDEFVFDNYVSADLSGGSPVTIVPTTIDGTATAGQVVLPPFVRPTTIDGTAVAGTPIVPPCVRPTTIDGTATAGSVRIRREQDQFKALDRRRNLLLP